MGHRTTQGVPYESVQNLLDIELSVLRQHIWEMTITSNTSYKQFIQGDIKVPNEIVCKHMKLLVSYFLWHNHELG